MLFLVIDDGIRPLQRLEVPRELFVALFRLLLLRVQVVNVRHQHRIFCEEDPFGFLLVSQEFSLLREILGALVVSMDTC
jgi:hypothetical protein